MLCYLKSIESISLVLFKKLACTLSLSLFFNLLLFFLFLFLFVVDGVSLLSSSRIHVQFLFDFLFSACNQQSNKSSSLTPVCLYVCLYILKCIVTLNSRLLIVLHSTQPRRELPHSQHTNLHFFLLVFLLKYAQPASRPFGWQRLRLSINEFTSNYNY